METGRGALALVAADGAVPASPGSVLLEEMLAGWRNQQLARRLTVRLAGERERVVRQFADFTGCWPWQWTAAQAEEWLASGGWAHSTVRSYQGALALFLDYACDPRYGWVSECEQRAGAVPVQVFHERNTAVHVSERGGRISPRSVDERFASWRGAAGLPAELSVHCLRHSYVSHLIEDGVDPLFVQQQVGHSWASTTATYTTVGQDARNRMLRSALARAFAEDGK